MNFLKSANLCLQGLTVVLGMSGILPSTSAAQNSPQPNASSLYEYKIKRVRSHIILDGLLSEPDWAEVQTIGEIDVFTVQDNYTSLVEPTASMTFTRYGITQFQVQYWDGASWVDVPGASVSADQVVPARGAVRAALRIVGEAIV